MSAFLGPRTLEQALRDEVKGEVRFDASVA
jgi:hypothetical protein